MYIIINLFFFFIILINLEKNGIKKVKNKRGAKFLLTIHYYDFKRSYLLKKILLTTSKTLRIYLIIKIIKNLEKKILFIYLYLATYFFYYIYLVKHYRNLRVKKKKKN